MKYIKNFKKKNIILKLDSYRKLIRNIKLVNFYKNKIFLVSHSIHLSGYSLKILREYFCSKVFEIYNYKDNFHFFALTRKSENYLYNYKFQKPLNKSILLKFLNYNHLNE